MANRTFQPDQWSDTPGETKIHAAVAFNSSGTPVLLKFNPANGQYTSAGSGGNFAVSTFTRTGTGVYILTLKDSYLRIMEGTVTFISNTNPVAPLWSITVASDPTNGQAFGTSVGAGTVRTSASTVKLTFCSSANTAADPAATEIAVIHLLMQNMG